MAATGDTGEDIGRIWNAIKECAKIGVDERVILAIIMQESHGDVGVQTTFSPGDNIPTGGLMQCGGDAGHPGQHGLSQVGAVNHRSEISLTRSRTPSPPWFARAPSTSRATSKLTATSGAASPFTLLFASTTLEVSTTATSAMDVARRLRMSATLLTA